MNQSQPLSNIATHLLWLLHILEQKATTPDIAEASWMALLKVQAAVNSLIIPAACVLPGGCVELMWRVGQYYAEIKIVSATEAEWFFNDSLRTDDYWGCDWNIAEDVPVGAINRLKAILPISA